MGLAASERQRMGQRGKTYVHANHDYAVLAKRFLTLLYGEEARNA
jgi:hypothetical protein